MTKNNAINWNTLYGRYYGNGVMKNKKEALKCFKRAAKYGYAEAVCMIGDYYFDDIEDLIDDLPF